MNNQHELSVQERYDLIKATEVLLSKAKEGLSIMMDGYGSIDDCPHEMVESYLGLTKSSWYIKGLLWVLEEELRDCSWMETPTPSQKEKPATNQQQTSEKPAEKVQEGS